MKKQNKNKNNMKWCLFGPETSVFELSVAFHDMQGNNLSSLYSASLHCYKTKQITLSLLHCTKAKCYLQ